MQAAGAITDALTSLQAVDPGVNVDRMRAKDCQYQHPQVVQGAQVHQLDSTIPYNGHGSRIGRGIVDDPVDGDSGRTAIAGRRACASTSNPGHHQQIPTEHGSDAHGRGAPGMQHF